MPKRIAAWLLAGMMLVCLGGSAWAEAAGFDEALTQAAEMEAEQGNLRSIVVHVRQGEDALLPSEADSPESAWMKALAAALEARWARAEETAGDILSEETRRAFLEAAEAELAFLEPYGETEGTDPLMDLLRRGYLQALREEVSAAETEKDPIAFAWQWTQARQKALKALYFLNRYYHVSVRKACKEQMNSALYEGALVVSQDTVDEIAAGLEQEVAAGTQAEAGASLEKPGGAGEILLPGQQAGTEDTAGAQAEAETSEKAWGPETWHRDPSGAFQLRIYNFDPDRLTMMIELQAVAEPERFSRGKINLSQWQKYTEGRFSVGTFYQADQIEIQEEKIRFSLPMNVMVDGRLHKEIRGKISLKLPAAKAEEDAHPFEEAVIPQDFLDLQIGDVIQMGYYEQDGDAENLREPIQWQVISLNKKKAVALVVSVYALESRAFGTAGDETEYERGGLNWKTCGLRAWLNGDFYDQNFTPKEKKRIREATNVTKDPSGRVTTKDHVFLLSETECRRYMKSPQGLTCMPTAAAAQKLEEGSGAVTADGSCRWWVRELVRAVKLDRSGNKIPKTYNLAGYVAGSKGMLDFRTNKGLRTYEEGQALVRPAMWIQYDPKEAKK